MIPTNRRRFLEPKIREHVAEGSNVHTDSLPSYQHMSSAGSDFVHNVIDHAECYAKGNVHTNGMENFWSLLKRTVKGTYVSIEPFHLFRYLDEQAFRFNTREMNDSQRFVAAGKAIIGKRLTYRALTGKDLAESCAN